MKKIEISRDPRRARAVSPAFYEEMTRGEEGLHWLDAAKLGEPLSEPLLCVNTAWGTAEQLLSDLRPSYFGGGSTDKLNQNENGGQAAVKPNQNENGGQAAVKLNRADDVRSGADSASAPAADLAPAPAAGSAPAPAPGSVAGAGKARVNLLALGDVGGTVLIGLKLLGGDVISEIGICDINPQMCRRWEYEMNQTAYPWDYEALPAVKIVDQTELFDCDVFVFCASKAVPPVGGEGVDVRMVQFDANRKIVGSYARMAREAGFRGLFAVVSDPVEPLCREAFLASNRPDEAASTRDFDGLGLRPEQVQGYGLGVMNGRAAYYAKKDPRFASFLTEGRAYGPHGKDLVIANSVEHYDDQLSRELTTLAAEANLRTRETGFKPYIAPALSSAAISILLTLRRQWHYSSVFLGGVYMGCKNRFGDAGLETEALALPEKLYERLRYAYERLDAIR